MRFAEPKPDEENEGTLLTGGPGDLTSASERWQRIGIHQRLDQLLVPGEEGS